MSRRRTARLFEQLPATIAPWYCPSNKRGYATREDAQAWLRYLQATRDGSGAVKVESREYRCALPACGSYHLTSGTQQQVAS